MTFSSKEQYINELEKFIIKPPQIKIILLSGAEVYSGEASRDFFRHVDLDIMYNMFPLKCKEIIDSTPQLRMFKLRIPSNARVVYKDNIYDTIVEAIKTIKLEDFDSVNIITLISVDGYRMPRCIDYDAEYVFKDAYDLVTVCYNKHSLIVPRALIIHEFSYPFGNNYFMIYQD